MEYFSVVMVMSPAQLHSLTLLIMDCLIEFNYAVIRLEAVSTLEMRSFLTEFCSVKNKKLKSSWLNDLSLNCSFSRLKEVILEN